MEDAGQVQPVQVQPAATRELWMRGLFMLFFAIALSFGQMVLNITAIVQFIWLLAARERNEYLAHFGVSLSNWFAEVSRFQSCASDDKPFPWRPWP